MPRSSANTETQGFEVATETSVGIERLATPLESITVEKALLSEVPYTLPIGWFDGEGVRQQSFTLKPYTGEEELALSALTTRYQDKVAEILPLFFSRIVETIGGIPVSELAKSQNLSVQKLFENMFLADCLQILLQLRLEAIGSDVQLSGRCPACQTLNKDKEGEYSDLSTVEVQFVKGLTHPVIEVVLPDGVKIFDDHVRRIQLRPPKLYDMKRMAKQAKDGQAEYKVNHRILMNTVVGMPESSAYGNTLSSDRTSISTAAVEDLYKRLSAKDRKYLSKCVNAIANYGPSMVVDMTCRACGYDDWVAEVPWRDLLSFLSFPD